MRCGSASSPTLARASRRCWLGPRETSDGSRLRRCACSARAARGVRSLSWRRPSSSAALPSLHTIASVPHRGIARCARPHSTNAAPVQGSALACKNRSRKRAASARACLPRCPRTRCATRRAGTCCRVVSPWRCVGTSEATWRSKRRSSTRERISRGNATPGRAWGPLHRSHRSPLGTSTSTCWNGSALCNSLEDTGDTFAPGAALTPPDDYGQLCEWSGCTLIE
jgi:hypothetical protein